MSSESPKSPITPILKRVGELEDATVQMDQELTDQDTEIEDLKHRVEELEKETEDHG